MNWYDSIRLKRRSYSSFQNSCPRRALIRSLSPEIEDPTVDTAFGHAFGTGIQSVLMGKPIEECFWDAWMAWDGEDCELLASETKRKDIWYALDAVERFKTIWEFQYADRFKLLWYRDKPAVELSFRINMPNGDYYIGFLDGVLIDTELNQLIVLETKTTSSTVVDEAMYANSSQGVGYGVVLDSISEELGFDGSSWQVFYLSYQTKQQELHPLPFTKTSFDRAVFLKDLWMKFTIHSFYREQKHFPKNGDSCFSFNRHCPFFGRCDMSLDALIPHYMYDKPLEMVDDHGKRVPEHYDFEYSFETLMAKQQELLA